MFHRWFGWWYPRNGVVTFGVVLVLTAALLLLLTGCPGRREAPSSPEGTVIQVRPLPSRPRTVYVVVRYASGAQGEYRLTRGDCVVGDRYPSCADEADR